MNETTIKLSVAQLLRMAAGLWLGYLLMLAVIDWQFIPPDKPFTTGYYLINGLTALLILGLSFWQRGQVWLGRAFLPLIIVLMAVVPLVTRYQYASVSHPGPFVTSGAETILLMALVLTAWQYRWRHVAMFGVGTALLNLVMLFGAGEMAGHTAWFELLMVVIQTISYLVVGYLINTLIAQLRQQQQSLQQANAQLAHYASTLEHLTISRERNRLARELHDTLAHTLSALSVQLETVKAYWSVDAAAAQQMLDRALEATRSGLQETRRALKSLRASPLDDLGLGLALRRLGESAATRAQLQLELSLPEPMPTLSPDVEQCVYRVAQEAVANVTHHAGAQRLQLQLAANGGDITLQVRDDGRGFDAAAGDTPGHFGLSGMRERAQLAGGRVSIDSRPGHGTTVQLSIGAGSVE